MKLKLFLFSLAAASMAFSSVGCKSQDVYIITPPVEEEPEPAPRPRPQPPKYVPPKSNPESIEPIKSPSTYN